MSLEQIPAMLRQMVPFIDTVGLTIDEVLPGHATARHGKFNLRYAADAAGLSATAAT